MNDAFEVKVSKYPVKIASRLVAENVYKDYNYVVSISGTYDDPPVFDHENVLFLHFDDVIRDWQGYECAKGFHIAAILSFAERIAANPGSILVHCAQGVSRSSATAILLLNFLLGPGHESSIFDHLHNGHPFIKPNRRIIEIGDSALRADGRIEASVPER